MLKLITIFQLCGLKLQTWRKLEKVHQRRNVRSVLKMHTACAWYSNVFIMYTLWETLFPIIKNIHPYSEIWRALPPIQTHTGRQKLPSFFTLWKTLLPIMSRREVCMDQGTGTDSQPKGVFSKFDMVLPKEPIQCQLGRI